MGDGMAWQAGRYTLFNADKRPVAEVSKIRGGWCWFIAGCDASGETETCSAAMSAAEQALGVLAVKVASPNEPVGL